MSDVIENSTVNEQTGSPEDAIAAMIAANRRNNPQPDNSAPDRKSTRLNSSH